MICCVDWKEAGIIKFPKKIKKMRKIDFCIDEVVLFLRKVSKSDKLYKAYNVEKAKKKIPAQNDELGSFFLYFKYSSNSSKINVIPKFQALRAH